MAQSQPDPLFSDLPNDLRELMSRPLESFNDKPLLPACHVFGTCTEVLTGLSSQKGTRYFAFVCQPEEWGPDAPKDANENLNGFALSDYEFPNRERVGTGLPAGQIWWTPKSTSMVREFFEDMGFPSSKSVSDCIREMQGRKVLMEIGQETSQNGRTYNVMMSLVRDPRKA